MRTLSYLLFGLSSIAHAAPPVVSNVTASQMPGTRYVDIYYDLADADGDTQTILINVSSDGGLTYSVPVSSLSGAAGAGVSVGTRKFARWDAGTDFGGNFIERCKVRVTAIDGNLPASYPGMAVIPAGNFQMGDTLEGAGSPTANIFVSQFHIDRTEVSKELWDSVRAWAIGNGFTDLPMGLSDGGSLHPVGGISWYAAVKWCNARSLMEGLNPCYYTNVAKTSQYLYKTGSITITTDMVAWNANGYRLPTEAEWEKAARGGSSNKRFPWGDIISHSQSNYLVASRDGITNEFTYDMSPTQGYHPVFNGKSAPCGYFPANGYGTHDMAGNLWEWVWDRYGDTIGTPSPSDPTGPVSGGDRVLRGGAWNSQANYARCASRDYHPSPIGSYNPGLSYGYYGFRAVRR